MHALLYFFFSFFQCTTDRFILLTCHVVPSRRILVNMDDNIIEHYTNQSAFLIEFSEAATGHFQVTLVEV